MNNDIRRIPAAHSPSPSSPPSPAPLTESPPPADARDPALLARARSAIRFFLLEDEVGEPEPYGTGHINRTYAVAAAGSGKRTYLLQLLNTFAFREPFGLMDNIVRVTEHIARRLAAEGVGDIARRAPAVYRSRSGNPYHVDADGGFWRVFRFVENAYACEVCDSPRRAASLGRAVGRFQSLLSDLPGPRLVETVPGFHDARKRYAALERAIAADRVGRVASVAGEIDFYKAHREGFDRLIGAMESGEIPERITHNDTKINNLLFDRKTDEAICIIDLDTVMPGTPVYDFGDLARTAASSAAEDDPDPSRMHFLPAMYESIARGYAEGTRVPGGKDSFLSPAERALLPEGGKILAMLMGVRFLTDYLEGDVYYHIDRPGHNLDRTRTQAALIASMERHRNDIQSATESAFAHAP